MNIVFVAHGGLASQSTYHIISIAEQLILLEHCCIVCIPLPIPENEKNILETAVRVVSFDEVKQASVGFPNDRPPDLIHCWTPREVPKCFTEYLSLRYSCPYFVHLEDNEREILNRELEGISYSELASLPEDQQNQYIVNNASWRIHPAWHWEFLKNSSGCTVLIDRLKEHVPSGIPVQLFWPGYDSFFLTNPTKTKNELRSSLKIPDDGFVVLYSGAFHGINIGEVSRMMAVLSILRKRGMPVYLIKTGANYCPDLLIDGIQRGWVRDMGVLPRAELVNMYALTDVLIQPGHSDPFNDYRFPSKLPEALISKVPVILPYCNLGKNLINRKEAIITYEGSMDELSKKLIWIYTHPEETRKIAQGGYEFALQNLNWKKTAALLERFYCNSLHLSREQLKEEKLLQEEQTDYLTVTSDTTYGTLLGYLNAPYDPKELIESCFRFFPHNDKYKDACDMTSKASGTEIYLMKKIRKKSRHFKRLVFFSILEFFVIIFLVFILCYFIV